MSRARATAIGFTAVLMWALLALLTVRTAPVPPLQLNVMAFAMGGLVGLAWTMLSGGLAQLRAVSWRVYAFGTAGLFGYHLFYFSALRLAPAAEASLIAYLWPLLIVLFSGLLPGERLRPGHVIGAVMAFAGAGLLIADGLGSAGTSALPGYALALLCALTWSGYSILSRRMGTVPTAAVTVFCLMTAVLSVPAHLALETPAWPVGAAGWAATLALGLGPVGLAFFTWDVGVKRGDIQLLGTVSYAAPLLSTLALVLAGSAAASIKLALAAAMIAAGAALAAYAGRRAARPAGDVTPG
ncbi:DMT family transporter [Albidovulum sp.]|jgi:drug/metabolite transporter (DMT)-like permease|uniref:aromatic amino acid exporter YddG n=1 Tax=Albidovulum sp. TaxID=1872424 RepID=UPI00303BD28E